jgi:hypothetical protein
VLERRRVGVHPGHVHPALVGEGVLAHVGLVGIGQEVEQLVRVVGGLREPGEPLRRDAVVAQLELEVRDDRHQVRVPAALAVAVERALDERRPLLHRGQRVRHRALRIVVGVDADARAVQRRAHGPHRLADLSRQRRAVGVAQRDVLGARLDGRAQAAQRVAGVGPEAVEEVLRVVDHPLALADEERDGVGDHAQVLLRVHAHDLLQVQ